MDIKFPFEHFPQDVRDALGNWAPDRRLYIFRATITKQVVYSEANEVHRTGETVRDPIMWTLIAPNNDYAEFAFRQKFESGFRDKKPSDITVEVLPVCAEIEKASL